jgi:hypothetical protein
MRCQRPEGYGHQAALNAALGMDITWFVVDGGKDSLEILFASALGPSHQVIFRHKSRYFFSDGCRDELIDGGMLPFRQGAGGIMQESGKRRLSVLIVLLPIRGSTIRFNIFLFSHRQRPDEPEARQRRTERDLECP